MNLRGMYPIRDNEIKKFFDTIDYSSYIYSDKMVQHFKLDFIDWIKSSKNNNLHGFDEFTNPQFSNGVAAAFDWYYLLNKNRRFRFYRGDFMYHQVNLKHGFDWKHLDDDEIRKNDAVILSVPFSDYGFEHPKTEEILTICDDLDVPVFLDFCYYNICKNIDIDLTHKCIDTIAFSLSKFSDGLQYIRAGIRLNREYKDDGLDITNEFGQVNHLTCGIGVEIMNNFSIDHNWNKYSDTYYEICNDMNLEPTNTITIGLGGDEYKELNRGSEVNRVCVSDLISRKYNEIQK